MKALIVLLLTVALSGCANNFFGTPEEVAADNQARAQRNQSDQPRY
jgi:hypothetical protein